jgi:PAS domain S-box-containing protein
VSFVDFNLFGEKILESTYDGIILVDADCKLLLINGAARKTLNIKDPYIGEHIGRVIPSSRLPITMKTRSADINRYQALTEDTIIIYSNFPIFDYRKHVIGGIAVFRDLSGIDAVPADLHTMKSLKETQIMMRAIMDSTQDAVSIVDENGVTVLVNKAHTRMTGWKEEDVIGRHCTALDAPEGKSVHMRVLKSKVPVRNQYLTIPEKGKEYLLDGTPIIVDNELKGSVLVVHDIAEIKAIANQQEIFLSKVKKLEKKCTFDDILTKDPTFIKVIDEAKKIASTPATIYIHGEKGTEVDEVARSVHEGSNRKYNAFVEMDCANKKQETADYELFGYPVVGGAVKCAFENADHGTLYIKNIDTLGPPIQEKLLYSLREKAFMKNVLGENPVKVNINVRIVASSNSNLEEAVVAGAFNEELYYRLNIFFIKIPPLRMRPNDVKLLADKIIARQNLRLGTQFKGLDTEATVTLMEKKWEGNIFELESCLTLAMIHTSKEKELIGLGSLIGELETEPYSEGEYDEQNLNIESLDSYMEEKEKEYIIKALCRNEGNKTKTAKELNISIRSLYYRLERHGILGV